MDGYTCSGGSHTVADTCVEVCGDGLNLAADAPTLSTTNCDDGNVVDNDGCSSTCTLETPIDTEFTCTKDGNEAKLVTYADLVTFAPLVDTVCKEVCNDADYLQLDCDGDNRMTAHQYGCGQVGDTLLANGVDECEVKVGYICQHATTVGKRSTCTEKCGDGIDYASRIWPKWGDSYCDDKNNLNNDGCSSTCKVEAGFECVIYEDDDPLT